MYWRWTTGPRQINFKFKAITYTIDMTYDEQAADQKSSC